MSKLRFWLIVVLVVLMLPATGILHAQDDDGAPDAGLAAQIPEGWVAVPLHVPIEYVPDGLAAGDRVDILHAISFIEVDEQFQTPLIPESGEMPIPRLTAQRTISDALVLAVTYPENGEGDVRLTLAVRSQDAVLLLWATESDLPTMVAMRPATDVSRVVTDPVTLEYFLATFNMIVPDRFPFAVDPD